MLAFTAAPADFKSDPSPFAEAKWINKENPFGYREYVQQWISPDPKRHQLGLVGGNNVSLARGNLEDVESDLRGITRPNTWCPALEHSPLTKGQTHVRVDNRKTNLNIDITPIHLPEYQMWGYTGAPKPMPFVQETCGRPYKY